MAVPDEADWRRRAELKSLLRACRARKASHNAGTGSLRQQDAAVLAGLSVRTYAALERGTATRPSLAMIESVASALDMSAAERSALHVLARGQDPPMPLVPPADDWPQASPQLRNAIARLNVPAGILDETWTILASNTALAAWTANWSERAPLEEKNVILLLFSPECELLLPEVHTLRQLAVAALRYQYLRNLGSDKFAAVVERLLDSGPEARELWHSNTVDFPQRRYMLRVRHPSRGIVELSYLMGQLSPRMSMMLLLAPGDMVSPWA